MKIAICYFSGTGNTQKVVNEYVACLQANGHEAEALAIDLHIVDGKLSNQLTNMLANVDMLGVGYPVHAFNAPSIVLKFAKLLPKRATKTCAFILNTSGEPLKLNNVSSLKVQSLLKRRNYVVGNEYHYCMPYNIIFRHTDEMAYKMWTTAKNLIPLDVKQLLNGQTHRLKRVFCGRLFAWIMRCQHWGGRLNGKHYKVNEQCIHCQKCANVCPTNNITVVDGKFKFGNKCLMCMRCAHFCSQNAIKIGWFNKWKVNGAYNFTPPQNTDTQTYNRMLTKAYNRYFSECNARIANADNITTKQ